MMSYLKEWLQGDKFIMDPCISFAKPSLDRRKVYVAEPKSHRDTTWLYSVSSVAKLDEQNILKEEYGISIITLKRATNKLTTVVYC